MRPDEHKKKKNAAYKKKHGMSSKPSNETPDKKEKVVKKSDDKQDRKNQQTHTSINPNRDNAQGLSSDESSSDASESHQTVPKKKQFGRREIVSNWQKYELQPEADDKVTVRGEKYETLLNMAGEAMSRFRFRDELEWEDEQKREDETCSTEEQPSCLQLNPADLTQSLACVPVHRLLDIDEDLFPKEQLESIIQTASNNSTLYLAKETNESENSRTPSSASTHQSDDASKHRNKTSENAQHQSNKIKTIPPKVTSPSNTPTSISQLPEACSSIGQPQVQVKHSEGERVHEKAWESSVPPSSQTLSLQDDDLDKLLDMDFDQGECVSHEEYSQLPSLAESDGKNSVKSPSANDSSTDKKDEKESEDLEDWLDSILD